MSPEGGNRRKGSPLDELEEILNQQRVLDRARGERVTPAVGSPVEKQQRPGEAASPPAPPAYRRRGERRNLSSVLEEIRRQQLRVSQALYLGAGPQEEIPAGSEYSVIRFEAGDTAFAVPMDQVAEIGDPPRLTKVPGLPRFLPGVANFRGEVVATVDLTGFLDRRYLGRSKRSLFLHREDREVIGAVLVDSVQGIAAYDEGNLQPEADPGSDALRAFDLGHFSVEDRSHRLVDLLAFIESDDLWQPSGDLS